MKKILKYSLLVVIGLSMLVLLTGCGNKTIIATKPDTDSTIGSYDVRLEISFAKDAISNIKIAMTFDDESIADFITSSNSEAEIQFEREGDTVVCELSAEKYKDAYGVDFSTMSRAEIIEELESDGYTVEK